MTTKRAPEILLAERLAQLDVVACRESELSGLAPAADFPVVVLGRPVGHVVGQQVGQPEFDVAELALHCLQRLLTRLEAFAEVLYGREQRLNVLALGLGLADAPRARVALVLQRLGLDLQGLAALVEREVGVGVEYEAASGQVGCNIGRRMAE